MLALDTRFGHCVHDYAPQMFEADFFLINSSLNWQKSSQLMNFFQSLKFTDHSVCKQKPTNLSKTVQTFAIPV